MENKEFNNQKSSFHYFGKFNLDLPITTSIIRLDIADNPKVKLCVHGVNLYGWNLLPLLKVKYFSEMEFVDDSDTENAKCWVSTGFDPAIVYSTKKLCTGALLISILIFSLIFSVIEFLFFWGYRRLISQSNVQRSVIQVLLTCFTGVMVFLLIAYAFVLDMYGEVPLYQILFHARLENFQSFSTPGQSLAVLSYLVLLAFCEVLLFVSYSFCNAKFAKIYFTILMIFSLSVVCFLNNQLEVDDYFSSAKSDFIRKNYAIPIVQPSDLIEEPRNLILIFMESMEWTYSDSDIFGDDLLHELSLLAHEGLVFDGHIKTPGAMFTADGLASQLCGVPLMHLGFDIHDSSSKYSVLLEKAPSIFNILKVDGYRTAAIFGSSGRFTQIGNFFKFHGIDEVYDKDFYIRQGYSLADNKGFGSDFKDEFVYQKLKEWLTIYGNKGRFAVTMQTIDTHFPEGYAPKEAVIYNDHRDSVRNASRLLSDFIRWAKQQSWYLNTTIVIVGDHPWLDGPNTFTEKFTKKSQKRQLFNLILNSSSVPTTGKVTIPGGYTSMDMAPTILDALGVKYSSQDHSGTVVNYKFGLGTSLYSLTPTLISIYGKDEIIKQLKLRDPYYESLF